MLTNLLANSGLNMWQQDAAKAADKTGSEPLSGLSFSNLMSDALTDKEQQNSNLLNGNLTTSSTAADAMLNMLTQSMMQSLLQSVTPAAEPEAEGAPLFDEGATPALSDVIDMVNPLQHIPLVSQYYQRWTGDDIGTVPQIAGSALYGGVVGVAASFVNIGLSRALGDTPINYVSNGLATEPRVEDKPTTSEITAKPPAVSRLPSQSS